MKLISLVGFLFVSASLLTFANSLLATEFELDYLLLKQQTGISASGTSRLCFPYDTSAFPANAAALTSSIGEGESDVQSVSRFLPNTDAWETYVDANTGTNFQLNLGEGYEVQVESSIAPDNRYRYRMTGMHSSTGITLYSQGDSLPSYHTGTSNTGINEYCPPYHATSMMASDLFDELGGSSVVVSISKFIQSSDSLLTYTGHGPGAPDTWDFVLSPGESYTVQVASKVSNFLPALHSISAPDVRIVERRPGCVGPLDGGWMRIENKDLENAVGLRWHGGAHPNLVFRSTSGKEPSWCTGTGTCSRPSETDSLYCDGDGDCGSETCSIVDACASGASGVCKPATCPGSSIDSTGCDVVSCGTSGCEIGDRIRGTCSGSDRRCFTKDDCTGGQTCGGLAPRLELGIDPGLLGDDGDTYTAELCNNADCTLPVGNCFDNVVDVCESPAQAFCDELEDDNYVFKIDAVKSGGLGSTSPWDEIGGIVFDVASTTNCCFTQMRCTGGHTAFCTPNGNECQSGYDCVQPCACTEADPLSGCF